MLQPIRVRPLDTCLISNIQFMLIQFYPFPIVFILNYLQLNSLRQRHSILDTACEPFIHHRHIILLATKFATRAPSDDLNKPWSLRAANASEAQRSGTSSPGSTSLGTEQLIFIVPFLNCYISLLSALLYNPLIQAQI